VSGGGTGTHRIDATLGIFTELQAGSYVFMDDQYNACALIEGDDQAFETALMIDTRVVSANTQGLATVDAGLKAMATDAGPPQILAGAGESARYMFMGDEQGAVIGAPLPLPLSHVVTLAAPHCDPTVNLYDHYHVVSGDSLTEIWPVTARGRSR
jgi:D-serine deaminase-like pyridoxal phosphate-dependent protein